MFLNTLHAEWTKLRTTRSFWATTIVFFVLSWGWAALMAATSRALVNSDQGPIAPADVLGATMALTLLGFPVLMIQAIMVISTEYRYGLQSSVYLTNPRRWEVAVAKLVLYMVIAAALIFLGVAGALFLTQVMSPEELTRDFHPFTGDEGKRILWLYPLSGALVVVFCQGMALLLRQTAGAVSICLILYIGVDELVRAIPKIGGYIIDYMPFSAFRVWSQDWPLGEHAFWDTSTGSGVVFLVWSLGLWACGLVLLLRRDA